MREHTVSVDTSTTPSTIAYADNFNVAVSFVDRHLEEGRGDKVAIRDASGDTTYAQLAENANRAGNALLGLGIGRGERVLMMVKDCAAFYYLFWGAIKAGIVPVPLNTLLRAKDYTFMIEDSGCAAVVYSPEFAAEVEPALEAAERKPDHAFRTEGDGPTLAALIDGASAELAVADATPTDDCFWLYSSGTTGTPKGAVHCHRDMVVTSQHYGVDVLGVREDDVCFSAAKLFFAYGMGNGMTFPLWSGATAVLYVGPPTPQSTFDTIEQFKPSIFFGVPTLYAAQLKALEDDNRDLSSLRACVSAGEALPSDIFRRWKEQTGVTILDGIGSTEALHIFISNTLEDYKPGSTGKIVPGYDARIEDENGYFHYCGRNDDMLKVGGIWCSPFEIEAKLVEHPKVLEAAIVGRADADTLIKPEAYVVLNDAADAGDGTAEDLLQHCKQGLAKYKYPRWFNFVEELPKTATGKIQRFKLRS